jgi:hypothetical protein
VLTGVLKDCLSRKFISTDCAEQHRDVATRVGSMEV